MSREFTPNSHDHEYRRLPSLIISVPIAFYPAEEEPVCVYAVGLLARAMDNQDIAASFREKNNQLVPVLLSRLHRYRSEKAASHGAAVNGDLESRDLSRPFAEFGNVNAAVNGDHASTPTKNEVLRD